MGTGAGPSFGHTKGRKTTDTHSLMDNVHAMSDFYPLREGFFGKRSKRGNVARLIASTDPLRTAHDFYNRITQGLKSTPLPNGKGERATTPDGYTISIREVSSSPDHSPAIDIHIRKSTQPGEVKEQKIHFVKED